MILANLLRRKLRTSFTLIGIALAVGAMVALTAVTQGALAQFEKLISGYRGDVVAFRKGVPDPVFSMLEASVGDELSALPRVKAVYPLVITMTKMPGNPYFLIMGLPAGSELLKRHALRDGGAYFSPGGGELILGARAADEWGKGPGDHVSLNGREHVISGIYETKIRLLDTACIMDIPDALKMSLAGKINVFCVDLQDRDADMAPFLADFPAQMPELEAFDAEKVLDSFDQIGTIKALGLVVGFIAMSIAAVGILNTMMMSVYERTREIGLLRAVGWSGKKIMAMILAEGLVLALLGGALGILFGYAGTEVLLGVLDVRGLDASYAPELFGRVMLFSLFMGLGGALLPGWTAVKISPVEALRYE